MSIFPQAWTFGRFDVTPLCAMIRLLCYTSSQDAEISHMQNSNIPWTYSGVGVGWAPGMVWVCILNKIHLYLTILGILNRTSIPQSIFVRHEDTLQDQRSNTRLYNIFLHNFCCSLSQIKVQSRIFLLHPQSQSIKREGRWINRLFILFDISFIKT